jgi:hypothetical protein
MGKKWSTHQASAGKTTEEKRWVGDGLLAIWALNLDEQEQENINKTKRRKIEEFGRVAKQI